MHFAKISSPEPAIGYLTATIARHLETGERVLWLISGGSCIPLAAEASRRLTAEASTRPASAGPAGPHHRLTVSLVDERYGPPGHADSNWQQLLDAGFSLPGATLVPILAGASLQATGRHFAAMLQHHLAAADYSLGLFGLGPDGHTAGILPHSEATAATQLAIAYAGAPIPGVRPAFERLTMTAPAIRQLDEAVVYAVGEAKGPVLNDLAHRDRPLIEQPAQVLKSVPAVTIFTDYRNA